MLNSELENLKKDIKRLNEAINEETREYEDLLDKSGAKTTELESLGEEEQK